MNNMVVIGGSRGAGRAIAEMGVQQGMTVLTVARNFGQTVEGAEFMALDAAQDDAAERVFSELEPDLLVIGGGVHPPAAPLHQQSWSEFSVNWEADVRIAFNFLKAALSRPLRPGSSVILLSSGAALAGSPISGGYAGSKRTQLFMANYAQKESDRLGLGLRFASLAPRIMPDTALGGHAVAGYARYLGITEAAFVQGMSAPPTPLDVAKGVFELAGDAESAKGKVYVVSGNGLEAAPL